LQTSAFRLYFDEEDLTMSRVGCFPGFVFCLCALLFLTGCNKSFEKFQPCALAAATGTSSGTTSASAAGPVALEKNQAREVRNTRRNWAQFLAVDSSGNLYVGQNSKDRPIIAFDPEDVGSVTRSRTIAGPLTHIGRAAHLVRMVSVYARSAGRRPARSFRIDRSALTKNCLYH
jgi:hypothetical protein